MDGKKPGFTCGHSFPDDVCDGTMNRTVSPTPGGIDLLSLWGVRDYLRRVGYLKDAWVRAVSYSGEAIARHVGEDFRAIISGIIDGLLIALAVVAISTATGGAIGAAAGSLAGGVGAVPGAVAGAEFGLAVGNFILTWLGVGFLLVYIGGHLAEVGEHVKKGTTLAWDSRGSRVTIDVAAREIAEGVGVFFSLFLQAVVLYLTKRAGGKTTGSILKEFRESLLFKRCPLFEPWLVKNYPRLRARFVKLEWKVLDEGPPIVRPGQNAPVSSIPEWIEIRVGSRVFKVFRNKEKLLIDQNTGLPRIDPRTGQPETIGPALKHLDEQATMAQRSPTVDNALKDLNQQIKAEAAATKGQAKPGSWVEQKTAEQNSRQVETPSRWPTSEWAKQAQTDFPISSLAGALDQAEAQLMFQAPNPRAKPLKLGNWELIIDTTGEVWRVFHAEYKPNPQW